MVLLIMELRKPEDCSAELFLMLRYTVACANNYFRMLHHEGLWMEPSTNLAVAKAGHEMCASRHSSLMTHPEAITYCSP